MFFSSIDNLSVNQSSLIDRHYLQLPDTLTLSSGLSIVQSNLRVIQPSVKFIVLTRLGLDQNDDDTISFRFNEIDSDSLGALMNHPELATHPVIGLFESSYHLQDYLNLFESGSRILVVGSYYQSMIDLTTTVNFLRGSADRLSDPLDITIYLSRHGYQLQPDLIDRVKPRLSYLNLTQGEQLLSSDQLEATLIYHPTLLDKTKVDWLNNLDQVSRVDLNLSYNQQQAELDRYRIGRTKTILTNIPFLKKVTVKRLLLFGAEISPWLIQNYVEMNSPDDILLCQPNNRLMTSIQLFQALLDLLRAGPLKERIYEYQTILKSPRLSWVDLNRLLGHHQLKVWP